MVKIRLMRLGKRKQPYFRVVVADSRSPRDGRIIENIGKYHPRAHPSVIDIDEDRAMHWLQVGAQPSDPVRVLFQKTGIWSRFTGEPQPALPSEESEVPPEEAGPTEAAEGSSEEGIAQGEGRARAPSEEEPEDASRQEGEGSARAPSGGDDQDAQG
jgi:small subunit ribosomal protein S16